VRLLVSVFDDYTFQLHCNNFQDKSDTETTFNNKLLDLDSDNKLLDSEHTINTKVIDWLSAAYSALLFILIKWLKEHEQQVTISQYKIIFSKTIGIDSLRSFCKLFEELTIDMPIFIHKQLEPQWICDFQHVAKEISLLEKDLASPFKVTPCSI
jgi:hypothetical protein